MLPITIKFFFIYYFSFYICFKLLNNKITFFNNLSIIIIALLLACLTYFLGQHYIEFKIILPLVLLWIILSCFTHKPQITFVFSVIAFILSYCIYAIASFSIDLVIYILFGLFPSYVPLAISSAILQLLLIILLLKIKRFKNGMRFLYNSTLINIATILCLIFIVVQSYTTSNKFFLFGIISSTLVLAFLIYWWQAQITKSYRRSLELRELESLRTEVAELNLKIQKLSEDNEKLARITHRDNTLITTLKNSTVKYLSTDFKNPAEAIAARDKLISNINALSAGRTSLPSNYNEKTARNFNTGISLLDELLHHMDEEAIERKIDFAVHFGTELANFIPKDISESDLVHTVDDLLKNAFKATTTCEKRIVQLQFYKLGKHFVIEVADSCIPFEVESLVNMGIEKRTTYADGSGIGLMDIWSTKDKYGATYHLEEYSTAAPFSKKISLTFDKKNRYSIRTWRKNEILSVCRRADLQVYDHYE